MAGLLRAKNRERVTLILCMLFHKSVFNYTLQAIYRIFSVSNFRGNVRMWLIPRIPKCIVRTIALKCSQNEVLFEIATACHDQRHIPVFNLAVLEVYLHSPCGTAIRIFVGNVLGVEVLLACT